MVPFAEGKHLRHMYRNLLKPMEYKVHSRLSTTTKTVDEISIRVESTMLSRNFADIGQGHNTWDGIPNPTPPAMDISSI